MIPNMFKMPGIFLVLTGIALTITYTIQPADISMPVFAIVSSYMETKYFTVSSNNIFEELIILCFLFGFLLTSFSKDKNEKEFYSVLRGEAWKNAILVNSFFLLFNVLFIYGFVFVSFLIANLFSTFLFYHLFYWHKKRKYLLKEAHKA